MKREKLEVRSVQMRSEKLEIRNEQSKRTENRESAPAVRRTKGLKVAGGLQAMWSPLALFIVLCSLFIGSCETYELDEYGTLQIVLPESGDASARSVKMPWPTDEGVDPDLLANIEYIITVEGGGGTETFPAPAGGGIIERAVYPGRYTVTVNAYLNDSYETPETLEPAGEQIHYAKGEGSINVKAGRINPLSIILKAIICRDCVWEEKDADCVNPYTLTVIHCASGHDGVASKTRGEKDPDVHTKITLMETQAATCAEEGYEDYYQCEGCEKTYQDEDAINEIVEIVKTQKDPNKHTKIVKMEEKDATCVTTGNIEHFQCEGCDKYYEGPYGLEEEELEEDEVIIDIDDTAHLFDYEDSYYRRIISDATCISGGVTMYYCTRDIKQDHLSHRTTIETDIRNPSNHAADTCPRSYVITGSVDAFTAKRKAGCYADTAIDLPIQAVIEAIKADVEHNDCTIQFGNGSDTLDIGTDCITFDGFDLFWYGGITLLGRITSANNNSDKGTIALLNGASITSGGDSNGAGTGTYIANTAENGRAINLFGSGSVNITGGTVTATGGGTAVYNTTGIINISGGAVSAAGETGIAVYNADNGIINVMGTPSITSVNIDPYKGTIYLGGGTLNINGGTVGNTASHADSRTIYNDSNGTVTITSGIVRGTGALSGTTIYNNNAKGLIDIQSSTVSATNGIAVYSNGKIKVSGTSEVTSENTSNTQGTIYLTNSGTIDIQGGTVRNTVAGLTSSIAIAIRSFSNADNAITISGGIVETTGGLRTRTIIHSGSGIVTIKDNGVVRTSSNPSNTIENIGDGTVNIEGGEVFNGSGSTTESPRAILNLTGTINISGGKISGSIVAVFNDSGTVEITGGEVTCSYSSNDNWAIRNGGIVNISGGRITGGGQTVSNVSGILTITDGTIEKTTTGNLNYTVYTSGAVTNIEGGTISAQGSSAVYTGFNGTTTIIGGTISAQGINGNGTVFTEGSGSTTNINGGTIEATADNGIAVINGYIPGMYSYPGRTIINSGSTISAKAGTAVRNTIGTITINGGTISATEENGRAVESGNNNNYGAITTINGGTISAVTEGNAVVRAQYSGAITIFQPPTELFIGEPGTTYETAVVKDRVGTTTGAEITWITGEE